MLIRKKILLILCAAVMFLLLSCKDYVTDLEPLIDKVEDRVLNDEADIPFLITGVKAVFAAKTDNMLLLADGYSDQLIFDGRVPGASYANFQKLEIFIMEGDNGEIESIEKGMHELRYHARQLVRRTNNISFNDKDLKNEALFTGYFFDGYARFCLAAYFGIDETTGGHTIDVGPFIASSELYQTAIEKLMKAKEQKNLPKKNNVHICLLCPAIKDFGRLAHQMALKKNIELVSFVYKELLGED